MNRLYTISAALFVWAFGNATVYIEQLSQHELNNLILKTDKIIFADGKMLMCDSDSGAIIAECPVGSLRNIILLNSGNTSTEASPKISKHSAYPNPTTDILHFSDDDEPYTLLDSNGRKVCSGLGSHLDMIGFAQGTYFLVTKDGAIKVIKR